VGQAVHGCDSIVLCTAVHAAHESELDHWWGVHRFAQDWSGAGWLWMGLGGYGWVWVVMDGSGWLWMGLGGYGWVWVVMDGSGWLWMFDFH